MKWILLFIVCFCLWQCCFAPVSGWYDAVEKESEIKAFDTNLVRSVFFSKYEYELNSDSVSELYYKQINLYLDSVNYGTKWPEKIEGTIYRESTEEVLNPDSIKIGNTIHGVGVFIHRKFIGDETRLKLILTTDDNPPRNVILDFDIIQKSRLVHHSRAYEWLRTF